jgi:hypothetical protein
LPFGTKVSDAGIYFAQFGRRTITERGGNMFVKKPAARRRQGGDSLRKSSGIINRI